MQELYAKHIGADWRDHLADPQHVGAHRQRPRRRAVGDAPGAQGQRWCASCAGEVGEQRRRNGYPRGAGGGGRGRARSRGADHRLRAPLRHLQARQPDLPGHRRASSGCSRTRSGRVQLVFSGKAHPADRPGQEVLRQVHEAAFDAELQEPRRVHRGLRHQRRPPPGAGRGRLAEQPAPPAGGERHQRPEGAAQRRPQLLGARRLVGRGLRRPQRLRDRRRHHPRQRRGAGPPRRRARSTTRSRTRSSRSTTSATSTACRAAGSSA